MRPRRRIGPGAAVAPSAGLQPDRGQVAVVAVRGAVQHVGAMAVQLQLPDARDRDPEAPPARDAHDETVAVVDEPDGAEHDPVTRPAVAPHAGPARALDALRLEAPRGGIVGIEQADA